MAALQEISRIVTSTLDIDQVYERFAAEAKKLVDFDRLVLNTVGHEAANIEQTYWSGASYEGQKGRDIVPLEGTLTQRVLETGRSFLREDIETGDPLSLDEARRNVGIRCSLAVPLFSKGRVAGALAVHSRRVAAYGPREQSIIELLAAQIAPTVENARLYKEIQASIEEKAVVDEVARIVTSTLDIDQVYEKFAAEVKKLVDFERIAINVVDDEAAVFIPLYISGINWDDRKRGIGMPLTGAVAERILRTGRPHLREDIRAGEGFSFDAARLRVGLRSWLSVPLFKRGRTMGTLMVHSDRVGAYGLREQAILERLADQIAPAVENARLYRELQASTEEKAVVDEVARIVSSTLHIDQVYDKFAAELKKLVDFDRVGMSVVDHDAGSFTPTYLSGVHWGGREVGTVVPLEGTAVERVLRTGRPILREDIRTGEQFLGDSARLQAGLLSGIMVPLFGKGQLTGVLHINSRRAGAFGPREQAILERLADQIAPAVEQAKLYADLLEAHGELESRVEARTAENARLYREREAAAEQKAVVDEVARIVTSTLDIDQVYEKFASEVKKLVDFDRVTVDTIDQEAYTFSPAYDSGIKLRGREVGTVVPIAGTALERMLQTGRSFLRDDIRASSGFKHDPSRIDAGLRSHILVPLSVHGRVFGSMSLQSRRAGAYGPSEQVILERLADQIAPAVENAQLYKELRASTEQKAVVDEVARIVTSTLDIEEVYGRFAAEVKKLVDFDRISINIIAGEGSLLVPAYVSGIHLAGREPGDLVALKGTVLETVLKTGQPSLREIGTIEDLPYDSVRIGIGLRSHLTVPLFNRGRILGGLSVLSCRPGAYGPKEQSILERLADHIAPAVENARLYEDLQKAHNELESRVEARTAELIRAEEQLAQAQKMEVVGQLAGGVAHDFNNLLTPILGFSALGIEDLNPDHPARGYFQQVHGAAERGAALVGQLLSFSRRQAVEPKVVDLNELVLNTDQMLRRLIGENIELVCIPAPGLGTVLVDPGQMGQVLINMAINARDAMPSGGKLTIETARANLDADSIQEFRDFGPGPYVKLSIKDTGTGMDEGVRSHLFEPFFTTKEVGKGTGLGLATCYGIVKQAGGDIRVQSEPGKGTTFEIYLPQLKEDATKPAEGREPVRSPKGIETVLLVEDEPMVRRLAAEVLRRQGYTVLEAANGEEALKAGQEHGGKEIHLLLTDVVMPQMGGRELADCLKPLMPRLKVLFTSGFPDQAGVPGGEPGPFISFLPKPYTPAVLAARVREALDTPGPLG